ncbi:hypothetical protein JCM5353_001381 [Sporobolomyces roseus]
MDRLPFELLNLIVYFIEADSSLPTRRSALASLSRTNKTFHNIATSKLYLHVILTSENRVGQWGKVYASKLNPWNLKGAKDELRDLLVPTSITFIPSDNESDDLVPSTEATAVFPRDRPHVDPLLAVSTPLTSFFFRNLTSLSVSPESEIEPYFVAALLGPTQALRTSPLNLDVQHDDLECATCFIFESIGPFEFALDEEDFELEQWEEREEERAAYWERCCSSDTNAGEEPEWLWDDDSFEATERYLISKAWTDYESFRQLTLVGPRIDEPDFPAIRVYSFAKLESLTLTVTTNVQVKLILLLGFRFPSLSQVKLLGLRECEGEFPAFVLLWRVAVAERKGTLYPPSNEARLAVLGGFPQDRIENLESILTTDANQAVVLYPGPNLLTLDVSELVVEL